MSSNAEAPVHDDALHVHRENDLAVLIGLHRAAVDRIGIDEAGFEAISAVLQRLRGSHCDRVNSEIRIVQQRGGCGLFIEFPDLPAIHRLGILLKARVTIVQNGQQIGTDGLKPGIVLEREPRIRIVGSWP